MPELTLSYRTHTYSTGIHGRAISNARASHYVTDDAGGEAMTSGEMFMNGVGACGVNMMGRIAKAEGIPLDWVDVVVEAYRDTAKPLGEVTVFDRVDIRVQLWGVEREKAEYLVAQWKRRCPLYGSVAVATPNTTVQWTSTTDRFR
jgi:uncharacterized OsmC-like protein